MPRQSEADAGDAADAGRSRSTCSQESRGRRSAACRHGGLPPETQQALTGLMARLILEHADQSRMPLDDGGRS